MVCRGGSGSLRHLIYRSWRNASRYLEEHIDEIDVPDYEFRRDRVDARPVSYGVRQLRQLFTDRQIAVFGHAFKWVKENSDPDLRVNRALRLALSNALATNNRLCSYARDYGRLAPLFSLRCYALPAMPVELNPFHVSAGRGTLKRNLDRVQRSSAKLVRRHTWDVTAGKVRRFDADYSAGVREVDMECGPAHAIKRIPTYASGHLYIRPTLFRLHCLQRAFRVLSRVVGQT